MVSEMSSGPRGRLKGWFDRGGWVQAWNGVYLATLVVATAMAVTDSEVSLTRRAVVGGIAALEAAW